MLEIGNWNELEVTRIIEAGLYLDGGEREVFLPHHRIPDGVEVGDNLKVMIYLDSKAQPVATTMPPIAVVGQFACLKANDAGEHGAFLDWGIEKDLLLPESEQVKPVSRGDDCVVYIMLDPRNGKPIATARIERHLSDDTHQLEHNQQVELMIYSRTDLGYKVLIDRTWPGLLYFDQSDERLRYGDIRPGYIARVRPDGKVDVSLRPMGKEAQLEGIHRPYRRV